MTVSFRDALKLAGVAIVTFCAVFVCTFFLNFYLDAKSLDLAGLPEQAIVLYDAQMATAKLTVAISGGFLGIIAVIMLFFYIKLYVDSHAKQLGILKAMGYSDKKIAAGFAVFGASVLMGTTLGFGAGFLIMPVIYEGMAIEGLPEISITFHPVLLLLIIIPVLASAAFSCLYAIRALRRPVAEMLRGRKDRSPKIKKGREKERGFKLEMCLKTLFGKKMLGFFVAFASFCFATMAQMSVSMLDLSSATMGGIILGIGIVLSLTTMFMATTSLVNGNVANFAVMKAFGYSLTECSLTVLGGFRAYAAARFALGTVYQYALLSIMVNLVFKDVAIMPEYGFDVPAFFGSLAAFVVFYEAVMLWFTAKIRKIPIKTVMLET